MSHQDIPVKKRAHLHDCEKEKRKTAWRGKKCLA